MRVSGDIAKPTLCRLICLLLGRLRTSRFREHSGASENGRRGDKSSGDYQRKRQRPATAPTPTITSVAHGCQVATNVGESSVQLEA
jgi:hypothetical protein